MRARHTGPFLGLFGLLLAAGPAFAGADAESLLTVESTPAPDGLVVDFVDGLDERVIRALADTLAVTFDSIERGTEGRRMVVRGHDTELARVVAALTGHALVESVEPNVFYSLFDQALERGEAAMDAPARPTPPNDPLYGSQWHMHMVGAEQAWTRSQGEGVVVAVIDTGVSPGTINGKKSRFRRVPDLKETEIVAGWNFVEKNNDPSDGNGHGTHVAGTIAQSTNNGFGVAGLAPKAKIMPIKVLSDRGFGSVGDIAAGIRFAADNGAKVINMSLGGGMYSATLAKAVEYAHKKGVVVVCAAGNGARGKVEFPAAYPHAVAVSALGPDGKLAFYSSWGKELALAAPGGDTRVDLNGDGLPDGVLQDTIARGDPTQHGFFPFQGTSMATPHVAAAAALVIAAGVTDPDRVRAVLVGTAKPLGDADRYGAGSLDAAAAVQKAQSDHSLGAVGIAGLLLAFALRRRQDRAAVAALGPRGPAGLAFGALVGAAGFFFLQGTSLGAVPGIDLLTHSPAAWPGLLFGSGVHFHAVLVHAGLAVIPLVLGYGVRPLRPLLGGFAVGIAGCLIARAALGSVDVPGVPGHGFLDAAWLVANGALAAIAGTLALKR